MDLFTGKMLIRKNGDQVKADEVLKDKILGLYFSAHWCPPCRHFTPILSDFYGDLVNQGAAFEIVFVSSDETPEEMKTYMEEAHGDWVALPYGDSLIGDLGKKYNIEGIPTLVVVKNDGTVISLDASIDVETIDPQECYNLWKDYKA